MVLRAKMMKEFIKKELAGWKRYEIVGLIVILAIVLFNATVLKDSYIAVISAVCGLLYTVIAGKGKISCYLFGLTGSGFYGYLSFINSLFGNMLLYVAYYIPMQIIGIFQWKKNLKKETQEIYKTKLSPKSRFILGLLACLISLIVYFILSYLGDTKPLLDSFSTTLSIFGMYLTVKRCIEQWLVWGIVNALCTVMWLQVVLSGQKAYSTVVMWLAYFILAIYFYKKWSEELKQD